MRTLFIILAALLFAGACGGEAPGTLFPDGGDGDTDSDTDTDTDADTDSDTDTDTDSDTDTGPPTTGEDCLDLFTASLGDGNAGDSTAAADDYDGSCEINSSGNDQVWVFHATATGTLEVVMDTTTSPDSYQCTLFVRTECDNAGSEVECLNGYGTIPPEVCTVEVEVTSGTDYYIFADSNDYAALPMGAVNGTYTLTLTMI